MEQVGHPGDLVSLRVPGLDGETGERRAAGREPAQLVSRVLDISPPASSGIHHRGDEPEKRRSGISPLD